MEINKWFELKAQQAATQQALKDASMRLKALDRELGSLEGNDVLELLKCSGEGATLHHEGDALVITVEQFLCPDCAYCHPLLPTWDSCLFEDDTWAEKRLAQLHASVTFWEASKLIIRLMNWLGAEVKAVKDQKTFVAEFLEKGCEMPFPCIPGLLEWEFIEGPIPPPANAPPSP